MLLEKEHLEQIGSYVKSHLDEWLDDRSLRFSRSYEIEQRERFIRIEDELKSQRELMKLGFEQVDKRFEQAEKRFETVDKRFDDVNKRFEQVDKRFEQNDKRFETIDKRFDDVNKRFDDMNKRFSQLMWMIGFGFTLTTTLISILTTINR